MSDKQSAHEFIQLYTFHEARLRAYVLSLVPRWADAEEIVQKASIILWNKFDQFEPGTNFFAWACHVARLEVKDFRKRSSSNHVVFTDAFLDVIAEQVSEMDSELPQRLTALQHCVQQLSRNHRELLRLRYDERRSVVSVAQAVGRPIENVYKTLSRVRQALHDCISRQLALDAR